MPEQPASGERGRRFRGKLGKAITYLITAFMLYQILNIGGFLKMGDIFISGVTHRTITLAFCLCLAYLFVPARAEDRGKLPWYDILAIVLILATSIYLVTQYEWIMTYSPSANPLQQAFGLITILLLLEGVRRAIGWILTWVAIAFLLYPAICSYLPGLLHGKGYSFQRIMEVLYLYPQGVYGEFAGIFATTLMAFLIFGSFLKESGAGDFFVKLASSLLGNVRGGAAKVSIIASSFFGMINGSPVANAASVGAITIPLMKAAGYRPHFAAGVEAVASTGGTIAPPVMGVAAFIMMDFLNVSYATIMVAAILPAFLYYLALFFVVDFEAARTGLRGMPRADLPSITRTLRDGWIYAVPIAALLFFMLGPQYSPETSGIYSVIVLVLATMLVKNKRMGLRKLRDALVGTTRGMSEVTFAMAIAGILSATFAMTGLGIRISTQLVDVAGGNMPVLLILTAVMSIFIGLALPASATYLLTALVLAPSLVKVGIEPIYAHFFCFYLGMSGHITPPTCTTAFVAASIAGAPLMKTGWTASRIGIVAYLVPFMFISSPALFLRGPIGEIVLAVFTASLGVIFLSAGMEGYLIRAASWPERILCLSGGVLLMVGGGQSALAGMVLCTLVTLWQVRGPVRKLVLRRG